MTLKGEQVPAFVLVVHCESPQNWSFPPHTHTHNIHIHLPPLFSLSPCLPPLCNTVFPRVLKEDWELTILLLLPGSDFQIQIEIAFLPTQQKHCQSEDFDTPRLPTTALRPMTWAVHIPHGVWTNLSDFLLPLISSPCTLTLIKQCNYFKD